MDVCLF